jgi:two-component system cell cycle sensor histidine kinase/response regulator CckA
VKFTAPSGRDSAAEQALRESEERFHTLADNISQLAWMADAEGSRFWYNRRWYEYTGTRFEEMQGWGWKTVHHPDHVERVVKRIQRSFETGEPWEDTFPLRGKDGLYRWFLSRALPIRDAGGQVVRWFGTSTDITKEREAEERSRDSEERFRTLVEQASDALFVHDREGRFVDVNHQACESLGYSRDELLSMTVFDVEQDFDHATARQVWEQGPPGEVRTVYGHQRRKDGSIFPVEVRLRACAVKGERLYIRLVRDITDRTRGEQALRESEAHARRGPAEIEAIYASAPIGLCVFDTGLRWVRLNKLIAEMNGLPIEAHIGKTPREVLTEIGERIEGLLRHVLETGEPLLNIEMTGTTAAQPGVVRHWNSRMVALRDEEGQVAGVSVAVEEVTEKKRAEEALRASEARLERTQEFSLVMALHVSLDGRWLKLPPTFARFLGYDSEEELLGKSTKDVSYPDDFQAYWRQVERLLSGELKSFEMEKRFIRKDGSITWGYANCSIVTDEQGRPVHLLTYVRDINAQKRAEEELKQSSTRERVRAAELETVMEAVPMALLIARDPECRIITGNRMAYDLLRVPPGYNLSKFEGPAEYTLMKDGREIPRHELPVRKSATTGKALRNFELDVVFGDGTFRHLLGDTVPLFGEDGLPRGAVGAFLDISDRKRDEERLRQSQKLESVGLLAGGIAHDFNNLLTGIMGNASLILDQVGAAPAERVREVIASAEKAAHLIRQLLAYSGKGQFTIRDIDVSRVVNEIADLVQFSVPKSVDLAVTTQKRMPCVRMDPSQLEQILMNLVINAGEAIGEGNTGKVTVSTFLRDVEQSFVDGIGQEVAPGRYVCIEVSDTGSGIDEDKKSKIFDPFFTSKFTGRGLGLAAVAGILRAQKGGITVESPPGGGTTFRVFLREANRGRREVAVEPETNGRGAVLVVDDEASVRDFIGAVLQKQGYRVLFAEDGREALALLEQEDGKIEAAVLDVVMPIMGANELLPKMKARQPEIKVLLTSGYSEAEARRLCAAYPGATFIQKPYTAQQILQAVETLLGVERR